MSELRSPISQSYTLHNHLQQSNDHYAIAKYAIVRRWLGQRAKPGMTLANIGCGAGYFNRIAHELGLSIVACEPDPIAYALARDDAPPDCDVRNCTLSEFAKIGVKADLLVCIEVLEHIGDDLAAVGDLASLLRPGGRAIVTVPALAWLYGNHDLALGHFRRYSASALRRVLSTQFSVERMRYFGLFSIPIVLLFSRLLRRDYPRKAGREGLIGRAYGAVCRLEAAVAFPVGTSLIAEAVRVPNKTLAPNLQP